VEQGLTDLHRETCDDCKRAHASRDELVRALPSTGPSRGRADWQARVWQQIAREHDPVPARRAWLLGGAAALLCMLAIVLVGRRIWAPAPEHTYDTVVSIEKGPTKKRGDAQVGDRVRTLLNPSDEVRIYRGPELVARCSSQIAAPGCTRDEHGSVAIYPLETAGDYVVVIITNGTVEPAGSLDRDLARIVEANVTYRIERELSVD
jgi:hypothetical protein